MLRMLQSMNLLTVSYKTMILKTLRVVKFANPCEGLAFWRFQNHLFSVCPLLRSPALSLRSPAALSCCALLLRSPAAFSCAVLRSLALSCALPALSCALLRSPCALPALSCALLRSPCALPGLSLPSTALACALLRLC